MSVAVSVDAALRAPRFTALPPLSLYVHIPWCLQEMPVLRFQLARRTRRDSRKRATSMR